MTFDSPISRRLASKFGFLALLTIVLTLPYGVPALWDALALRLGLGQGFYLPKAVDNQRFYLLFSIFVCGIPYAIWRILAPPQSFPKSSILWLSLGFVLLQFASAFQAMSPEYTLRSLLLLLAFYLGFLLIQTLTLTQHDIEKVFVLLLLGAVPLSLYALAQSHGLEFLPYSQVNESTLEEVSGKQLISSTFGHPNYMASYLTPLAYWALYLLFTRKTRLKKGVAITCFLSILVTLVVGGTRGAWLGMLGAALPYYLLLTLLPAYRRQLLFAAGIGVLLVLFLFFVPLHFIHFQFNLSQRLFASKEISNRFYYWLMAVEMFRDHPWFGVGYTNFNVLFWDAVASYQQRPESAFFRFILAENTRGVSPGFVHNDFLQIAAESGVFALLAWLGLWSALICQAWETAKNSIREQRTLLLSATFLAACMSMGIDALFNFPFHIPVSGFLFWTMLGLWIVFRSQAAKRHAQRLAAEQAAAAAMTPAPAKKEIPRIKPSTIKRGAF